MDPDKIQRFEDEVRQAAYLIWEKKQHRRNAVDSLEDWCAAVDLLSCFPGHYPSHEEIERLAHRLWQHRINCYAYEDWREALVQVSATLIQ